MLVERLQALWIFLKLLARNYQEDGCQTTAAALTYQTLFAVVPVLTITYTVLAAFEAFEGMGDMLQNFLFENIVPDSIAVMKGYLSEFSSQARRLSIPSTIVVAVTAFLMMFTIERTFNDIWRVQEPRQGFQRILMYWAILTLGPFVVVVSIASTTYILTLPLISEVTEVAGVVRVVPFALGLAFLTLIYATVPNCFVPLRHAFIGGIAVTFLLEILQQLFGAVMSQTNFEVIYGTFAAVPLFLIWLYIFWTVILFGAELTKGIGLFDSEKSEKIEPPYLQFLLILEEFFRCHRQGDVVTDRSMMKLGHRIDLQQWNDHKSRLLEIGLIRQVDKGGLVLSKDLNEVSLWQLHRALPWPLPTGFSESGDGWQRALGSKLAELNGYGEEALKQDIEGLFRGEQD